MTTTILRDWLPLTRLARITATSEDAAHPIVSAFGAPGESGWQAETVGPQIVSVRFREPMRVGRVRLVFEEHQRERTQEFTLACGFPHGPRREIVRQQFTFNPVNTTRQVEEVAVEAEAVTEVMLRIVPDISHARVLASMTECRIAARRSGPQARPVDHDAARRDALIRPVLEAYKEMPGLSLTRAQACVLFDLDAAQFDGVVDELTTRGVLQENERGQLINARS